MPDLIRFSDLKDSHPLTLDGNNDLFAIAVKNPSSETGYTSQTVLPNQVAGYVAEDATYVNLKTGASDNTVVKAINKTLENFADEFNTTAGSTYNKDDCVIYDGVLYQCTNPSGTTSGTFVTADWTQVRAVDVGTGGGGGGSADHITLTQAQYDALVQAGTVDPDAYYFISDGSPSAYTEKVLYTNLDESSWVSQASGDTITLLDDITQFDEVRFEGAFFETNNNTGYKLTHFCSATVPKATIVDCLNKYGDSSSGALQWQGIFDLNFISIYSGGQFSASYSLKIPTSTSILVKLKSIVGWTASQWGITKIVGINYDVVGGETHQYSTEEQVVGKWIDGSPVYEKTLIFNNKLVTNDNSTCELVHGVSNLGAVSFIVGAYYDFTSGGTAWATGTNSVFGYRVVWKIGSTSIHMTDVDQLSFSASSDRYYMFVIRYTKSSS